MTADARVDPEVPAGDFSRWLLETLTRHGRLSFRLACARLTPWESILVQHLLGRADVGVTDTPHPDGPVVRITTAPLTGIALWQQSEEPDPAARTLCWLRVPAHVLDMAAEEARVWQAREDADMLAVEAVVQEWADSGELDQRLVELADRVERVETVYVFIGRDIYSKSDAGSNTLTRGQLLESLRGRPPESWRSADRLFVVAAHCLFASGRSVRFEEFNGRQLSATALHEYLADRYAVYCAALDRPVRDLYAMPLMELARSVRSVMAEVDRSRWMRYRRINGLTFVKNEYLADLPLPREPGTLPELVADHGRCDLGLRLTGDVRADLRAMTVAAVMSDAEGSGPCLDQGGALGELVGSIVLSAVLSTGSDYGMSSCVRDLTRLYGSRPGSVDGVLTLTKGDFFCCCLPHTSRTEGVAGDELSRILWRAAQRMMYNRWHFAPGEFDREVIPGDRHYFFPPQVPDIAEHAEHHHGGHVASRVRFSVRAPGPQTWWPPLRVFGNGFRGCYDIRLVRMEGPAFTVRDMRTAVEHCSLVDVLWRTLAAGVERGELPSRRVGGFDKAWYGSAGWQRLRPFRRACRALSPLPSP